MGEREEGGFDPWSKGADLARTQLAFLSQCTRLIRRMSRPSRELHMSCRQVFTLAPRPITKNESARAKRKEEERAAIVAKSQTSHDAEYLSFRTHRAGTRHTRRCLVQRSKMRGDR
jgi:hypothetical protein